MIRLTWDKALAWRMARHHLLERATAPDLVRVVADICGLHAQVMSSAELSLWARIDGLERTALHDALWAQRTLVKLWAARGTLYLLPSAELGVWLAALGTYTHFGNAAHPQIDGLADAVGRALDGRVLSRDQLAVEVEKLSGSPLFGEWVRFSWGSYLKAAAFRGLICFAPGQGTQVRFTSPASWVPGGIHKPDADEALRWVTRRYLSAYAPASAEEVATWWLGPPMPRRGARLLASLGDETVEVDIEGQRGWVLASDVDAMLAAAPINSARLLPAFDPWVSGGRRRPLTMLSPHEFARVYRPQGWISPVLVVNGRIEGVWKHERHASRRLRIQMEPFDALPAWARTQLELEAERLASYLNAELTLTWA